MTDLSGLLDKPIQPRKLECWSVEEPNYYFKTWLGPTLPTVSGGHGGWEEVARPKRGAIANYKGTPLYTVKIEVVFDGILTNQEVSRGPDGAIVVDDEASVEGPLRQLSAMGGRNERLGRPPIVSYRGGVPGAGRLWVVNDLERGECIRRWHDGAIIRQFMTITFLEFSFAKVQEWESSGPANDALARHNAEEAAAASAASKQAAEDAANLDPAANPAVDPGPPDPIPGNTGKIETTPSSSTGAGGGFSEGGGGGGGGGGGSGW